MAQENKTKSQPQASSASEETTYSAIKAVGPNDETNNAQILRYQPLNARKKEIDILRGQILHVDKDIDREDADRLLGLPTWTFERVKS